MRHLLKAQLPDLPGHLRAVLALWVEGTLLALNGCQDTVTLALAHRPRGPAHPHTLRRLQRELLYDDADRIESWGQGQELEVARCFAPLLRWVRSWWVPTGGRELAQEPRVLAADPTSKQDDLVALVISGVYRQHAVPVAWHIVGAQAKESWIDHFCRLLRRLAPAVPATVPVHVLCDQGLCSRDLWAQIVALGWHPCLRYPPHVTFQPEGQTQRVPVRSLITGPGDLWVGTGRAFRTEPLDSTLIVWQAYGQAQPWVLLTDTPVAQTEPTLYACRNWIEQGFRGLKTVGDPLGGKWHKTRRLEPTQRVPLTRVFSGRASVEASGSVGLARVWLGQTRGSERHRHLAGRKAQGGRKCRCGGPRCAEDRGGRGVERAMEECDEGPAPTARVGSGAAGV